MPSRWYSQQIASLVSAANGPGEWYTNWPIGQELLLGQQCRLRGYVPAFEGEQLMPDELRGRKTNKQESVELKSSRRITTAVGAGAGIVLGAAGSVDMSFPRNGGTYIAATGISHERVRNLQPFRDKLLELYRADPTRWPIGSGLVVERYLAKQAVVVTSRTSEVRLGLSGKGVMPAGGLLANVAGRVSWSSSTQGATVTRLRNAVLAVRVVLLTRRGWAWWRSIAVAGVSGRTEDLVMPFLSDYFLELPDGSPEPPDRDRRNTFIAR